jgi:1-deoxy-D-xylulose-5-phosphate synthase
VGVALDENIKPIKIGQSEMLKDGEDLAILAFGSMVYPALYAAEELARDGESAMVVNMRFAKPLDEEAILKAAECGKIITVEENALLGGFGSAVIELLEKKNIRNIKVRRLGIPDKFIEHGSQEILKEQISLNKRGIYQAAKELLSENIFTRIYNGIVRKKYYYHQE